MNIEKYMVLTYDMGIEKCMVLTYDMGIEMCMILSMDMCIEMCMILSMDMGIEMCMILSMQVTGCCIITVDWSNTGIGNLLSLCRNVTDYKRLHQWPIL